MSKVVLNNFSGGAISSKLSGRVDLQKYASSCLKSENFVINPYGNLIRRGGTEFVCDLFGDLSNVSTDDLAKCNVRMEPVRFSGTDSKLMILGHGFVTFFDTVEMSFQTGSKVYNLASEPVGWYEGQGDYSFYLILQTGAERRTNGVYLDGVTHSYQDALNTGMIARLVPGIAVDNLYSVFVNSVYRYDEIDDVQFVQSGNLIVLVHPNHPPQQIFFNGEQYEMSEFMMDFVPLEDSDVRKGAFAALPSYSGGTISLKKGDFYCDGLTAYSTGTLDADYKLHNWNYPTDLRFAFVNLKTSGNVSSFCRIRKDGSNYYAITEVDPDDVATASLRNYEGCKIYKADKDGSISSQTKSVANLVFDGAGKSYDEFTEFVSGLEFNKGQSLICGGQPFGIPLDDDGLDGLVNRESAFDWQVSGTDVTDAILVSGEFDYYTFGTWKGTVALERSYDGGNLWQTVKEYKYLNSTVNKSGNLTEPDEALYRWRYQTTSGEIELHINLAEATEHIQMPMNSVNGNQWHRELLNGRLFSLINPYVLESEFSFSEKNGYPSAVGIYQERLVFAGTKQRPHSLWMSKTDSWKDFERGDLDDDGILVSISDDVLHKIQWIRGQKKLFIGTDQGEFTLDSNRDDEPVTPTNNKIRKHSANGAQSRMAVSVDSAVVFVQRDGLTVRELLYNYEADGYISPELTLLNDEVLDSRVVQVCLQRTPFMIVWFLLENGEWVGCTYNKAENVVAWHKHILSNKTPGLGYWIDGCVLSITTLPNSDGEDELWLLASPGRVGSVGQQRGTPAGKVSLLRLPKLIDADVFEDFSGSDDAHGYKSAYKSLPIVDNLMNLGAKGQINTVKFRLHESGDFRANGSNVRIMPMGTDGSPDLFSGFKDVKVGGKIGEEQFVEIEVDGNHPWQALFMNTKIENRR